MHRQTDERGFSLVEVLVALAILAVVASVTYSSLASGTLMSIAGEKQNNAVRLAQSLVDGWPLAVEETWSAGQTDYTWHVDVESYGDGLGLPPSGQEQDAAPVPLLITATVEWSDRGEGRSYRLQTIRLEAQR